MRDEIRSEVTSIYAKIQQETSQSLKKYAEGIKTLQEQTKQSWAFVGVKEALFWSVCLSILLLVGKAMLEVYDIIFPVIVWQIAYPCAFIPLLGYIIAFIVKTIRGY